MEKEKTFMGFRCSKELADKITARAKQEDRSTASVIRQSLQMYFEITESI